MKVLHIIKVAKLGGAEVYLSKILPEMNNVGIQSTFLAMINPDSLDNAKIVVDLMRSLGVEVIEIVVKSDFSWSMYSQIAKIIKDGKYDLVNAHLIHSEMYAAIVKKFFIKDLKIINTRHGYYPAYQVKHGFNPVFNWKDKFWWIYKFNSSAFNRTISISYGLKNLLVQLKLAKAENIDVIHYGFDYEDIQYQADTTKFRKSPHQILIIGRLEPVKGHTFAFQALPKVLQKFPDTKLVIVGTGYYEEALRKEVKERNLEDHVIFEGFQTAVHDYLKNSDITLIPSFAEGFCAVVLESNNNHTPVVCFDVPALNEIVENEKTGVIVPKFDVNILSDKLLELLEDKEKVQRLTDEGYKKLKSYFSMERMLKQTLETYQKVLSNAK